MLSGGYSNRFNQLNSNHAEHIKNIHQTERMDMIARNKKLQHETNKRRKALAIKRKLESQREEKRRQEILNKRREEQQRATEKYQRLNKNYTPAKEVTPPPESPRRTPGLEDALRAIRGPGSQLGTQENLTRQGSTGSVRSGASSSTKPGRVGSAGSTGGGSSVSGASQQGPPPGTFYGSDALNRAYYNKYGGGSTTLNARTAEHARQVAVHTELQSSSLRNLTNSRSLFEAQLEHHQHQLADHQRQALNQFNAAIRQEIDADATLQGTEDIESRFVRSNSVCSSVDSLDDEQVSDRATSIKASSETQLAANLQDSSSASLGTGQYGETSFLHSSQSDSCLPNYGQTQALSEREQLTKRYNEDPNYAMKQTSASNAVNSGSTTSGFALHRSHSSNSNVAVVQPISSTAVTQAPNNVYATQAQKQVNSGQSGVSYNAHSPPVTNGYYTQTTGDNGKGQAHIAAQNTGAPQGKDVNVVGPISASNMGRTGNPYPVDQFSNIQASNSKSFYLGGYSGVNYTVGNVANPDITTLNDADFHARTKAWTTPTPDILSPFGDTTNKGGASEGLNSLVTNVKPNSSRLTATNATLTTNSSAAPSAYSNTNPTCVTYQGSPAAATSLQQQNGGVTLGGYGQATTPGVYQNGVVYSKSSIPSTAIVTMATTENHKVKHVAHVNTTPSSIVETNSIITGGSSVRDEASENELSEAEEEEVPEKVVKGILKPTFNINQSLGSGRGRGMRGKGYTAIHHGRGRGRGQSMGNIYIGPRDSIEIAKVNKLEEEKPEKKSVRFAEKLVEEQEETETEYRELAESSFTKPTVKETVKVTKKPAKVKGRPPRPVSAKVASTTQKNTGIRESRVASAGTLRRGPFVRQSPKVTVSKQPPNENSVKFRSGASTTPSSTSTINAGGTGTNENDAAKTNPVPGPVKSNMEPVYDGNGLRLDRTPTDDEINWLWDKVRTCLSRNSTASSQDTQSQATDQSSVTSRQTAAMSSKYIDGNSLAPQFRAATRVTPNGNSMANEKEVTINGNGNLHTAPRKKISMDHLNSYSRKTSGLLAQRKGTAPVHAATSNTSAGTTFQTPSYSTHGPSQNGEVSESMAAFLTAENLAQQSVSDSHIEDAMETAKQNQRVYNSSKPQHKVPTALSMEEQRLLQSLERLNERLKMTETSVGGGTSQYAPRVTQYGRGFRGHQPLTSQRRYHSATSATSENRQLFRATSAGSATSNYGGHIAYH